MKLQENQRYTLNEVKQYLIESIESKAVSFCNKNGINVDDVKNTFYKWRIRNCKYFLTLCRIYKDLKNDTNNNYISFSVEMINKLLLLLAYSDDIDYHFTRTLDDTYDPRYTDDPNELHKRFLKFKTDQNELNHKVLKINDYIYRTDLIVKENHEFYIVYDILRNKKNTLSKERMENYQPPQYNYIENIVDYANKYKEEYNKAVGLALDDMTKENPGRYYIIPIHNYNESESPEYSNFTDWCVTNDHDMYHRYTKEEYGDAMFYFCLRDDYLDVTPNEDESQRMALDDYGTSMFAVLVTEYNEIVQVTSRWNHAYGGGDNVIDIIGLSRYLGFDPRAEIKYDNKEDDEYDEDNDEYDEDNDELTPEEEYEIWYETLWEYFNEEAELYDTGKSSLYIISEYINNSFKYNFREIYNDGPDNYSDSILFRHNFLSYDLIKELDVVCVYHDDEDDSGFKFYYYGDYELEEVEQSFFNDIHTYDYHNGVFLLTMGKEFVFCRIDDSSFVELDYDNLDIDDIDYFIKDYWEKNIIENEDINGDNDVLYCNGLIGVDGVLFMNEVDASTIVVMYDKIIGAYGDLVVVSKDGRTMIIENKNEKGKTELFKHPFYIDGVTNFDGIDNEGIKISREIFGEKEIIFRNTDDVMAYINKSTNESLNYINNLNRRMKLL